MSQTFGAEAPQHHGGSAPQLPAARYLVLIDSASSGARQARLFGPVREPLARFDAGAPEVQRMTEDLQPIIGASGPEWDRALAGHAAQERTDALVYTLDV